MVARSTTLSALAATPTTEHEADPLPLPRPPAAMRTPSSSTASSTGYSSRSFPRTASSSQTTLPPASSRASPKLPSSPSVAHQRPLNGSRQSSGGSGTSGASGASSRSADLGLAYDEPEKPDELDRLGYMYSMRVAALTQRLSAPPPPTSPMSLSSPLLPPANIAPDQRAQSSPMSFSSFRTPDPAEDKVPLPMRRKKSIGYLRLGRKDELKLPREFIVEFWSVLVNERGDTAWQQTVRGFLALVQKKAYKTSAGLSMREIPVLIDTFTSCIPSVNLAATPAHVHQTHLLRLLYDALPTSTYFATSTSDKDQDLLFRLRAEVQMLMTSPASPNPSGAAEFSPQLRAQASAAKANMAGGLGLYPPSPVSPITPNSPGPITPNTPHMTHSPSSSRSGGFKDSVKRKPSPIWTGDGNLLGNLIEAVGLVWSVPRNVLERDFDEVQRSNLEKYYLEDLKRNLTQLTRLPDSQSRARHAKLSQQLANLVASFPELTVPMSPVAFGQTEEGSFFTPPRTAEVFARLTKRVKCNSSSRSHEVLKSCQEMWNQESRANRERRVEDTLRKWEASIGSHAEEETAQQLSRAVADLSPLLSPSDGLPPPLDDVFARMKHYLSTAAGQIYSTTSVMSQRPPQSLASLFLSSPELFMRSQPARRALDDLADELKGVAVQEYVSAAGEKMGGVHASAVGHRSSKSGKDSVVEGFERLAEWIEMEIRDVMKIWGDGLGPAFTPAGIIISRQLPLFLAEMQVLEGGSAASSDVFALYDATARLMTLWDQLCPGLSHGFDADAFFEPHVIMWLRETEANETHQWVTRTVSMDAWHPEGELRHSQSVTDLFELIRGSTKTVRDLPLSDYKRSVFLVDLSRTASAALSQYATTVLGLFHADMHSGVEPARALPAAVSMGGKASAWLAKGKHTVHKLDQRLDHHLDRKRDVFIVPPAACVKLSNMGAAARCLEGLGEYLEAEESARVLREHHLGDSVNRQARQVFSITILRGQNLLNRGSAKPADAFVTVIDRETGERLFKSRTVLETEDPKWEQTFEVSLGALRTLELECYDRQLVGKHDMIGARTFNIDPRLFESITERDVVLPLSPRGVVHLRISTEGGEKHDVQHHLTAASRVLQRTAADMTRDIVDNVCAYVRAQLSPPTLAAVVKPLKDKKRGRIAVTDAEVDASLAPVFDYLDETFAVFTSTLTPEVRLRVTLAIWERIVDILIALLIPPLSEKPYTRAPLSPPEVDVVFKWLQAMKVFFNASESSPDASHDGDNTQGIPMSALQAGSYRDMLMLGQCLDLPIQTLRERAAAAVRAASAQSPGVSGALRALSLNPGLGSASRARIDEDNERVAEVLLRIVRMRPGTGEFLEGQMGALIRAKEVRGGL